MKEHSNPCSHPRPIPHARPIESYRYWVDALAALNGEVPVHSHAAHIFLLASNIFLTSLQFYWTSLIFRGIAEKLGGGQSDKRS